MAGMLTRDTLAAELSERAEITMTAARDEVRWFFDAIGNALTTGDEVRIHGFGSFKTSHRGARMGRNPRTGEAVSVPARRVVRFAPSTTLTAALKAPQGRGAKKAKG